jgi:transposase
MMGLGFAAHLSHEQRRRARAARPGLGRNSWLFAGSERGAERAALMYTLIQTAKLNNVDPQAWLADVLARIADTPQTQISELLPWNWRPNPLHRAAA